MIINNVVINFSDVFIVSSMTLMVLLLSVIMYYIPTILGIFWAKAKGINPNIMWLMILFYPGILALIIMRYMWVNELTMKNSFFKIYYIDKEAFFEIKNSIKKILVPKNIIVGIVAIIIFSIWFMTTGIYNTIRADILINNNELHKAKKYLIHSVINSTLDFERKIKNYNKTMVICEKLKDKDCQYEVSRHMYKQKRKTSKANLYLALLSANNQNFKTALNYLEPVKYLYSDEYSNIENAYYEYEENQRINDKESKKENELAKVENSQYTILNGIEDFLTDTINSLSDFDLSGTEEEIAEKVFLKMTAQGRVVGRFKTAGKILETYFNYSKIKRIKKLVLAKQLKALSNKKNYYYNNKIYNYKKNQSIRNKSKFERFKKCLDRNGKHCSKILQN